jgi:hypothetical protein
LLSCLWSAVVSTISSLFSRLQLSSIYISASSGILGGQNARRTADDTQTRQLTPTRSQNTKRHFEIVARRSQCQPRSVVSGFHCSGISSARRLADRRARLLHHLGLLSAFGEQIERLNAR